MMEQNKTECATGKAWDMSIQRDRLGQKELIKERVMMTVLRRVQQLGGIIWIDDDEGKRQMFVFIFRQL